MTNTMREIFLRHNAQTSCSPLLLEFVKAEGIYLYDPQGKAYIDFISGIGVSNIGHGHPEVIKAIKDQADLYLHLMVYGEYVQKPQVLFAKKICSLLPDSLSSVYFVSSGSEAIEGALKLAKRYTGRSELIGYENSYHGSTHGALSLMGVESFKSNFRPLLPGIQFLEWNKFEDLDKVTEKTAAVLMETIQGEAGVRLPSPSYLKELRKRCTETGSLLILDEIQCGFGRTGKYFAFEHYGIVPDILVLAKALGGGLPLGAFISSHEIMDTLSDNPILGHITTFGGHPLSCAAGLASLWVMERENLTEYVEEKSQLLLQSINHPAIIEKRAKGFMFAINFEDFEHNKQIIDQCILQGLIVDWFLHDSKSMRLTPPLTINLEEIKTAAGIILSSIKAIYGY